MKKFFISLMLILLIPLSVSAKEKVKVYIFEAGGCPYCEMQKEYLEKLDSYNEKFTIVSKELYVDHNDWAPGKDFILGAKTALAFNDAGFSDAGYTGTPFVVISNTYAAAAYSDELESVIDEAYDKGDKDVVGCISKGKDKCLDGYTNKKYESQAQDALEETLASQIAICYADGGSSCTDIYKDTKHKTLASDIDKIVAEVYSCNQNGDEDCTSNYSDDEKDIATVANSTIERYLSSDSNNQTSTPYNANKGLNTTAIVVLVLSVVVVSGFMVIAIRSLNKEGK